MPQADGNPADDNPAMLLIDSNAAERALFAHSRGEP
jgi:hypothetical protein